MNENESANESDVTGSGRSSDDDRCEFKAIPGEQIATRSAGNEGKR